MRIGSVITNDNFIMKKFAKYVLVSVFAFAFLANQAYAITVSQLMAAGFTQSQAELVIALLGGSDDNSGSCYTHTVTLRVGSTGSQVMAMQKVVGATADGKFGPATKAAVMAWQSNNGLVADGIVGPNTGAAMSGNCDNGDDNEDNPSYESDDLDGSFGTIDDVDELSQYNNEEVGEGEDDVIILGFDVDASNDGDIRLSSIKVSFDPTGNTGSDNLDDYLSEVSIWMGDDKIGEADVEDFSVSSSDIHSRTISLDNAIVRADETENFYVAVSAMNNLDSGDISGDSWTVDVDNIRYVDGSGVVTTDSSTGDINAMNQAFDFTSFASAADLELKITTGDDDDINDAHVIDVDTSDDTDGVELFNFEFEAEGDSDITVDDLHVKFVTVGADLDGIANTVYLYADGDQIASENVPSTATTTSLILFDDLDFTINAGDTVDMVVKADINDLQGGTFDEGDTITVSFGESETDNSLFDAEDEEGENLADNDVTGSASSGTHVFYSAGIMVDLVSVDEERAQDDGATDDTATFTIKYNITAFDNDVYVGDTASATTVTSIPDATVSSNRVTYRVDHAGTATVAGLSAVIDFIEDGSKVTDSGVTNGVKIQEGETGEFTFTVTRTNSTANGVAALFRAAIKGISWATTDTATQNVYDFNLEDYRTDYIFID